MSPEQKLKAAIERLEGMRSEDAWDVYYDYGTNATRKTIGGHKGPRPHRDGWGPGTRHAVGINYSLADALLIVTLHRTIDAQLEVLGRVLEAKDVERNWETLIYTQTAVALAEAILGGEQS